jgi:hypothetical protein
MLIVKLTLPGDDFQSRREAERIDAADDADDPSLQAQTFGAVLEGEDRGRIESMKRRPTTAEEYHEEDHSVSLKLEQIMMLTRR